MPDLKIIPRETYKRATWKNGLGFTDEIAIYPPDAKLVQGDFLWRLSSAKIENNSPFSLFPNHDRVLVVLKGSGIKLTHTFEEGGVEEAVNLPAYEPYEFPGDVPSRCELSRGPVTDFSLFIRKAEVDHFLEMVELGEDESYEWAPDGRWNFIFAVNGSFETEAGPLREGDTASLSHTDALLGNRSSTFTAASPTAKFLVVSLA